MWKSHISRGASSGPGKHGAAGRVLPRFWCCTDFQMGTDSCYIPNTDWTNYDKLQKAALGQCQKRTKYHMILESGVGCIILVSLSARGAQIVESLCETCYSEHLSRNPQLGLPNVTAVHKYHYAPPPTEGGGGYWIHSAHQSVCPSVHPSVCPCIWYSWLTNWQSTGRWKHPKFVGHFGCAVS